VGSDFQVNYAFAQNYAPEILGLSINNEKVVQSVLAIGVGPTVNILNDAYTIVGIDASSEYENFIAGRSTGIWHSDSFDNLSPSSALKLMKDNPLGIFVSSGTLDQTISEVNEEVELTVAAQNLLTGNETSHDLTVKILGTFDHLPGELGGDTLIASPLVINKLRSLSFDLPVSTLDGTPMNATKYLFKTKMGDSISNKEINLIREQLRQNIFYASDRSLKAETDDFLTGGGAFGIPGLLSLNFIVSVTAALISTFAFTAILMERRKGEFAVLRAIGAKQQQIYKIAVGENALLVFTAVIWGILIGSGITYLFNGIFVVFNIFLGAGPLTRQIVFPWINIILIGVATSLGMLFATLLSVRGAARQDLSVATRVV
ncbi:MAG: ABC transporter permease, partial [Candidatus Kariarchaeaceae archaeon]